MSSPRDYSAGTRAALATLSKGHCYYPNCHEPTIVFVNGEPIINYQIAHIKDANPGNRYDPNMTDEERASFQNLVLLCKPHHTYVDKTKPRTSRATSFKAGRTTGRRRASRSCGAWTASPKSGSPG